MVFGVETRREIGYTCAGRKGVVILLQFLMTKRKF